MSSSLHRFLDNLAEQEQSLPSTLSSASNRVPPLQRSRYDRRNTDNISRQGSVSDFQPPSNKTSRRNSLSDGSVSSGSRHYDSKVKLNQQYVPADNYDDQGLTPLMIACRQDDYDECNNLVMSGVSIDEIDSDGRTALFHAVTYSSEEIIQLLLQHGADPYIVAGDYERHCLHQACIRSRGALDVLRLLIKTMGKEAKLEQDKAGLIPIHLAINNGNKMVVYDLLDSHIPEQLKAVTKDYRDTALHLACRRSDADIVKLLLEYKADVNQLNLEGQTPLHISAGESDVTTMKYLHEHTASANIKDRRNRTALHVATETGNMETIEMLIDRFHSDVHQRSKDGSTLIHLASKSGHSEVANHFVERGVPIQMPNKEGATALHEACKQGHNEVVKQLIQKGSQIDMATKDGFTPLHVAVRYGKYMVVQLLLGEGASVNKTGGELKSTPLHMAAKLQRYSEQVTEMLIKSGGRVNESNKEGDTPLHVAIKHRNYPVVKLLIDNKANTDMKNKNGETPLHLSVKNLTVAIALEIIDDMKRDLNPEEFSNAINATNLDGETALHYCANIRPRIENKRTYTDLCKLLIDNHSDLNPTTNDTLETPLHYCARGGNPDVLRMILQAMNSRESNKAANQQNNKGWSPLLVACEKGFTSVVRTLLENEARVDIFDDQGKASLHIASENGHVDCVELLLHKKAYVDAKTKIGLTPVMLAAANGHDQLIELLVSKYSAGHDILAMNKRSSLHFAAENGHLHACKNLLELGSDPMKTDLSGQTAIHGAAENDHPEVVKMFLEQYAELGSYINKDGNNCAHIAAQKGSLEVMKALIKSDKTMAYSKNKGTGQTPLHLAAAGGHAEMVQLLLDQGASVQDEDKDGMNPLHLAAKFGRRNMLEVLRTHIPYNTVSNKTGFTAVHTAAEYDQLGCLIDMLIKVPASILSECPAGKVPEETEYGYTCLHMAAKNGHVATVRHLLNCDGVIVDQRTTKKGLIPIHLAIIEGKTEVASLLLGRSAHQISLKGKLGRAPLHFAAANGHEDLVQLLLGQGAEINDFDKNGWTPLHYAADGGYLKVVKYLVQMGAVATIEDKEGKAALAFAAKNHHLDVMKFLLLNDFDVEELLQDKKFLAHLMICCKLNNNASAQDFILNSPAPIYTAIKLTLMYREESLRVKDKSQDYLEIAQYCEEITHDILHIATTYGCEELLNSIDDAKQPLLDIMIDNEFKDCVAHTNVQSYLSDLWRGNDIHIEGMFSLLVAFVCFIFPPLWFFLCLPFHRWNKIPTLKFICHIISHIYFIIVLTLVIVVPWDRSYLELFPHPYEMITMVWFTGHLLSEITEPESKPIRVVELVIGFSSVAIHISAFFFENTAREDVMYIRDNVLAFLLLTLVIQLMEFLSLNQVFGPWSVIIASLVLDVLKFLVIMFLFIVGFLLHVAVIYKPVYNKKLTEIPTSVTSYVSKEDGLITIFDGLFFGLFGLANKPEPLTPAELERSPSWVLIISTAVFALYNLLAVIVLINLLIAMMSNTYTVLDERSDVEWKYGRAGIIRTMIKSYSMPVPANVFATLLTILWIATKYHCCCCRVTIDHFAKKKLVPFDAEKQKEDSEASSTVSETDSYDPEDENAAVPILHVVPWKSIAKEFKTIHGVHEDDEEEA